MSLQPEPLASSISARHEVSKQVAATCAEPSRMCVEQDSRHFVRLREHPVSTRLDDISTVLRVDTRGVTGDLAETEESNVLGQRPSPRDEFKPARAIFARREKFVWSDSKCAESWPGYGRG
jgi:hypothetical protein